MPPFDGDRTLITREKKMKGCAKFLNFIAFFVFLSFLIAFIAACAATAVVGFKPDIVTEDLLDSFKALTINGKPVTMEILTGFRTQLLIMAGAIILCLLITALPRAARSVLRLLRSCLICISCSVPGLPRLPGASGIILYLLRPRLPCTLGGISPLIISLP